MTHEELMAAYDAAQTAHTDLAFRALGALQGLSNARAVPECHRAQVEGILREETEARARRDAAMAELKAALYGRTAA